MRSSKAPSKIEFLNKNSALFDYIPQT